MSFGQIYTFTNKEIAIKHADILSHPFVISPRFKNLFEIGQGGDRPCYHEKYKNRTKDSQGYVFFVDLTTGIIDGVPAANAHSGLKLPLTIMCDVDKKKYGVMSRQPLGSNSGDAHLQGVIQLNLAHKSGVKGQLVAGGIFKGDGDAKNPKPHLLEFRNKSTSQNRFAIKYDELFLMVNYEPTLERIYDIQRSLPADLSKKISETMIKELPINEHTQIRNISFSATENSKIEVAFQKLNDKEIKNILIENMFLAAKNDHIEIIERILALQDRIPKLSPYALDKNNETILTVAEKHHHLALTKALIKKYGDINKIALLLLPNLFKFAKYGTVEQIKMTLDDLNTYPNDWLNYKDKNNDTPLMLAAINDNDTVLKFLLDAGADIKQKDAYGDSIFIEAIRNKAGVDTIKVLLDYNKEFLAECGVAFVIMALSNNAGEKIKSLIDYSADINFGLLHAISTSNDKAINVLIKHGADFNKALELANKNNDVTAIIFLTNALDLYNYKHETGKLLAHELSRVRNNTGKYAKLVQLSDDLQNCNNLHAAKEVAKNINKLTAQNKFIEFFKTKKKYKAVNDVFDDQLFIKKKAS